MIQFWDELERLPWRKKMVVLHREAQFHDDWGKDPLQFTAEVFRLRDRLAHGKPERVEGPIVEDFHEAEVLSHSNELQPEWYKALNTDWILEARIRFHELMIYLGRLFELHDSDHLKLSQGGISILTIDEG